jgi:hypothetical protein
MMTIAEAAHVVTSTLHKVIQENGSWKRVEVKGPTYICGSGQECCRHYPA